MADVTPGGFIGEFGLDWRLLLAQVVNFLIVLVVLTRFVFRPLLRMMRERAERIASGIRGADEVERTKRETASWEQSERTRVRREAARVLSLAEEEARQRRDVLLQQAEAEAEAMHDRAVAEAAKQEEDALARARQDVGGMVVDVAERVLGKRLAAADREAYREDALREVEREARGAR